MLQIRSFLLSALKIACQEEQNVTRAIENTESQLAGLRTRLSEARKQQAEIMVEVQKDAAGASIVVSPEGDVIEV